MSTVIPQGQRDREWRPAPSTGLIKGLKGLEGLETSVRRASRRLSLSLAGAGAFVATAITADSTNVATWVSPTFGGVAAVLSITLIADIFRGYRR